jgi:hypothetical protein
MARAGCRVDRATALMAQSAARLPFDEFGGPTSGTSSNGGARHHRQAKPPRSRSTPGTRQRLTRSLMQRRREPSEEDRDAAPARDQHGRPHVADACSSCHAARERPGSRVEDVGL